MSDRKVSSSPVKGVTGVIRRRATGPPRSPRASSPSRSPSPRRAPSPPRKPASGTVYIVTHRYIDHRNGGISTHLNICSSMEAAVEAANEFHDWHIEEHKPNNEEIEEYDEEGELINYDPVVCRHQEDPKRWAECDLEDANIRIEEVTLDPSKGVMYSDRL